MGDFEAAWGQGGDLQSGCGDDWGRGGDGISRRRMYVRGRRLHEGGDCRYLTPPVTIEDDAWICARAFVGAERDGKAGGRLWRRRRLVGEGCAGVDDRGREPGEGDRGGGNMKGREKSRESM